jgi:hemoglobin
MAEADQTPTLYERLGGTYGIAAMMDVLVDRLFANVWANRNPYVAKMHERNGKPGFKFMVTAWSVEVTGGPKCYSGRDMHYAHVDMVASEHDFDVVALEIAATLSFCGAGVQEQKEYMEIFESYRREVLDAPRNEQAKATTAS